MFMMFINIPEDETFWFSYYTLDMYKLNDFEKIDIMIVVRYINYFIYFKNITKIIYLDKMILL